jgi:hypothetical protein
MTTEFPSYERAMTAKALLLLADALGIKVGSDGTDVVTVSTSRVPLEASRLLHIELCKHKQAVIEVIQQEARGELVPNAVDAEGGVP